MSAELIQSTLEDMLFNENKLVTYKWLSKKFRIHINKAKQSLENFYNQNRGDRNLNAVYYLSGYVNYDKTKILKVRLIRDSDLEIGEKDFVAILSKHIYSLQCCNLKDLASVYLADNDDDDSVINEFSSVKLAPIQLRAENKPKVDSIEKKDVLKIAETDESCVKSVAVNGTKKSTTPKKKSTIMSMFTAMETNKNGKEDKMPSSADDKPSASESDPVKEKKQQNNKNLLKTTPEKGEQREKIKRSQGTKRQSAAASNRDTFNDDLYAAESSPEKSPEKDSALRRSPRKHGVMTSPAAKKAKKIQKVIRSSHEEEEEEEDEDIVLSTPVIESRKLITKQKLVNKTYLDDEGYLVTSREPVIETLEEQTKVSKSDKASPIKQQNEDEDKIQNKKPTRGKTKNSNPSPKKQSSLTSFFKK